MSDEMQLALFDYNERDKTLRDILVHLYEWQNLLLHFVQQILAKQVILCPSCLHIITSRPIQQ